MLKFRKMFDAALGSALTARDDQRFTRVGRYLARSKLDEIRSCGTFCAER